MTDPYKVLGVSPDASDEEIKKSIPASGKAVSPGQKSRGCGGGKKDAGSQCRL